MKPDLTLLYSQVGLRPGCSMEELQLAYRRRISELQPDHANPQAQSAESAELLRDLIAIHTTASAFHRRHGRLPGANELHRGRMRSRLPAWAPSDPLRGRRAVHALVHGAIFLMVVLMLAALVWWDRMSW